MAVLILLANTASPITVSCRRAGKSAPRRVGGVFPSFNATLRTSVRGEAKVIPIATSYLTATEESAIQVAIANGVQIACSGDILGNVQTLCSFDSVTSDIVPGTSPELWTMTFTINEVNASTVLLKYAPGDTVTGESFSRASAARWLDANGVWNSVANDVKRDSHQIGGVRCLLLEDARTSSILWSRDQTNAAWTKTNASAALNAVGLDGSANSGTTLTDASAVAIGTSQQSVTVSVDSATHAITWWVKKDAVVSRFPLLFASISGGTTVSRGVYLNTQTGAVSTGFIAGTTTSRVVDETAHWRVEITLTNNSTALNTTLLVQTSPARGTVIGSDDVAATGSTVVSQINVELNAGFGSSPIFTTTVAVTRSADSYNAPFTNPPQEMSVYIKFVEQGTFMLPNARLYEISSAAAVSPYLIGYAPSGTYSTFHQNTSGLGSPLAAAPALANVVEIASRLFGDGSVDTTQSLNSAASTASAQSAVNALASAWSGQLVWLNSAGTVGGFTGYAAIQSFKIVAGARSLAEMRAA